MRARRVGTFIVGMAVVCAACSKGNTQKKHDAELASVNIEIISNVEGVDFSEGVLTYAENDTVPAKEIKFTKGQTQKEYRFIAQKYQFSLSYVKGIEKMLSSDFCSDELKAQNVIKLNPGNNDIRIHVCPKDGTPADVVTGKITPIIHPAAMQSSFLKGPDFRIECSRNGKLLHIALLRTAGVLRFEEAYEFELPESQWDGQDASDLVESPSERLITFKSALKEPPRVIKIWFRESDLSMIKEISVSKAYGEPDRFAFPAECQVVKGKIRD